MIISYSNNGKKVFEKEIKVKKALIITGVATILITVAITQPVYAHELREKLVDGFHNSKTYRTIVDLFNMINYEKTNEFMNMTANEIDKYNFFEYTYHKTDNLIEYLRDNKDNMKEIIELVKQRGFQFNFK